MHYPLKIALVACVLILSACQSGPPRNRGMSGGRLDPTKDAPSEVGSNTLRSQDLIAATDLMAQDIAQRLDIVNRHAPPKIFVGNPENKTSGRHLNYQVFLTRLRAQLNSSGARHGIEFIRERQFVETQREREYGGKDPESTAAAYESKADYVLTCEIFDLPSAGTNYYLLDYQLVQLRDASTGPDVGAGAIVWENSYEVKFQ
ncbi:MAG: penicillin-binding protein activator LpoB [Phycisphaerales bacterium]|nr:penicillin-binding protein activator LpoB [Phycisphaerales bacterium]MCI0629377.1 penicillin-binding protein activator LpoB [Phycisphaerales bacterium]